MDTYGICPFRPEGYNKDVCPHCTFFVHVAHRKDCVFKLAAMSVIDMAAYLKNMVRRRD